MQRRRNVLHIYGCDHMVHADIKQYFLGYEIVGVRWLDDSSCNVQFKDEYNAKNALFQLATDEARNAAKEAGLEVFGFHWLVAKPYRKSRTDNYGSAGVTGTMYIRLATVQDVSSKGADRPLVQSSTLTGQAAALAAFRAEEAAKPNRKTSREALAAAGQAAWSQLMSSHQQSQKIRRKKRRAKGGAASRARRGRDTAYDMDAEFDRYAQAARDERRANN